MEEVDIFIRDYFNGKLNDEEARRFQEQYENDPEFRQAADLIETEVQGIRAHSRESIKKTFSQWEEEASRESPSPFPFMKVGIAASVLVALIFAGQWAMQPSHEQLFVAYYEPYENFEYTATRDEADAIKSNRALAYANYDAAKYDKAVSLFNSYLDQNPEDHSAKFFAAVCKLELGHWEEAKTGFSELEDQNIPYYSEASLWYISLIDIRNGQIESAKARLGRLRPSKDYGAKASELLDQLN